MGCWTIFEKGVLVLKIVGILAAWILTAMAAGFITCCLAILEMGKHRYE